MTVPEMFPVCFSDHFNSSALACFCVASRVDLEVQVGTLTLACYLEKVCPGVEPSGIMDSCVEMLRRNPLNFSRMIVFNLPPRVSAIAPWPAVYIHFFKDGMPDFLKLHVVGKEQGD